MSSQIVVVSGPPASGKDSITNALTELDETFHLFPKLKCGAGRREGYRVIEKTEFDTLLAAGKIAQWHERYGNIYAVDLPELEGMIKSGFIPVIHNGRASDFRDLAMGLAAWQVTSVVLHVPRSEAARRIRLRGTGDTQARLAAFDEEAAQVGVESFGDALTIDTSVNTPACAAREIRRAVYDRASE